MTAKQLPEFLVRKELQSFFRMSRTTLWRLEKHPKFPQPIKPTPGKTLYDKSAVAEFLESL
jgi:predicted DNA-binding transcriptional regulator AlpA